MEDVKICSIQGSLALYTPTLLIQKHKVMKAWLSLCTIKDLNTLE